MKLSLLAMTLGMSLIGCMITSEGARISPPPPAIQGSNDAQGNPISVPGAGMGVGAGNPAAPGAGGTGPVPAR